MLCTDLTLVGQDEGRLWAEPLHCGRWSCDVCNPLRRAAFIKLGILGQPNSFITLTDRRSPDRNKDQAAQGLVRARRSLWQQIDRTDRKIRAGAPVEGNRRGECKRYLYTEDGEPVVRLDEPGKPPFLAVFEETEAGWPHLHILARLRWVDQAWLADQMERLTGARVCWVERVKDPAKRAAYVAKYCGKAPHAFLGTKRYWTSQDWLPPEERERIETWKHRREWRVEHDPFPVVLERYRWDGYEVEEVDGGAWLTPPPVGEPRGPPGTLGEGRAGSSLSPSAPPSATPQQTNLTELWRYG